jgi:hypothetical protein
MNQEKNKSVSHNVNMEKIISINSLDKYKGKELKFSTNNINDEYDYNYYNLKLHEIPIIKIPANIYLFILENKNITDYFILYDKFGKIIKSNTGYIENNMDIYNSIYSKINIDEKDEILQIINYYMNLYNEDEKNRIKESYNSIYDRLIKTNNILKLT